MSATAVAALAIVALFAVAEVLRDVPDQANIIVVPIPSNWKSDVALLSMLVLPKRNHLLTKRGSINFLSTEATAADEMGG